MIVDNWRPLTKNVLCCLGLESRFFAVFSRTPTVVRASNPRPIEVPGPKRPKGRESVRQTDSMKTLKARILSVLSLQPFRREDRSHDQSKDTIIKFWRMRCSYPVPEMLYFATPLRCLECQISRKESGQIIPEVLARGWAVP